MGTDQKPQNPESSILTEAGTRIQTHQVETCRSFHRAWRALRCRISSVHHPLPGFGLSISVFLPAETDCPSLRSAAASRWRSSPRSRDNNTGERGCFLRETGSDERAGSVRDVGAGCWGSESRAGLLQMSAGSLYQFPAC